MFKCSNVQAKKLVFKGRRSAPAAVSMSRVVRILKYFSFFFSFAYYLGMSCGVRILNCLLSVENLQHNSSQHQSCHNNSFAFAYFSHPFQHKPCHNIFTHKFLSHSVYFHSTHHVLLSHCHCHFDADLITANIHLSMSINVRFLTLFSCFTFASRVAGRLL